MTWLMLLLLVMQCLSLSLCLGLPEQYRQRAIFAAQYSPWAHARMVPQDHDVAGTMCNGGVGNCTVTVQYCMAITFDATVVSKFAK